MLYLKFLKRLQQILRTHAHLYTHTNICFMRCTIFSSRFVREGGWVGITLKCEYKKGGMQRAVSFQAHISKSFSPWNDVWWVCIIIYICFMLHFSCFSTLYIVLAGYIVLLFLLWPIQTHCLIFSVIKKSFAYIWYKEDNGGGR